MKTTPKPDPFPTLEKLIAIGDLLGKCAEQFRDNKEMALSFLADCAEQCQYTDIKELWGDELTADILQFVDPARDNGANYTELEKSLRKDMK